MVQPSNEPTKYGLFWPGKGAAAVLAQGESRGRLQPRPADSMNWDTTQHVFIAGDNLEVLKLMQPAYNNKIKLIYIDPPYNTGNDFIYPDNFRAAASDYLAATRQVDSGHAKVSSQTETDGRFHQVWLNMMYPRLLVARRLLRADGFIFVSIDDTEVAHLTLIMDEIFGFDCRVANICWRRRRSQANLSLDIAPVHDHILCYRKTALARLKGLPPSGNTAGYRNPDHDPRGPYTTMPCSNQGGYTYEITTPTGRRHVDEWRFKPSTFDRLLAEGRIVFPAGGSGKPRYKLYLAQGQRRGVVANTWWDDAGANQDGTRELKALFGGEAGFDNPKPTALIRKIVRLATNPEAGDIVLDFFAGSGSTGQAVLDQNAADGGNRRYILIQLPEPLSPTHRTQKRAAALCQKLGLPLLLSDLALERLRRAGRQIQTDGDASGIDIGVRVFDYDGRVESGILGTELLYALLPRFGLEFSTRVTEHTLGEHRLVCAGDGRLLLCTAPHISAAAAPWLAAEMISWHRSMAGPADTTCVFYDCAFADDAVKANLLAGLIQYNREWRIIVCA